MHSRQAKMPPIYIFLNIFQQIPLSATSKITFGLFLDFFQAHCPRNHLHFRFKMEDKYHGYVWLDVKFPSDNIPVIMGRITVKILSLDDAMASKRKSRLRLKANLNSGAEIMRSHISRPFKPQEKQERRATASEEVVDVDDFEEFQQSNQQAQPQGGSIEIDFDEPHASKAVPTFIPSLAPPPSAAPAAAPVAAFDQDMFHFDQADEKTPDATVNAVKGTGGLTREQLIARRESLIQDKVKEALEFKQELDETARRESEEVDQAREKYDKNLTVWATNNKEKRNVRTLLTTMHTVLWPGNAWKEIGLGDVIEAKKVRKVLRWLIFFERVCWCPCIEQVKLQYRKAMLVVHPDRCSGMSTEIRFIAKRVFEAINEAYQEFLKKESV